MDLVKWRNAVGVADSGSFTAAAVRLNITQPALSRSIQAAEAELGIRLFDRSVGGVKVTPAGAQILAHARALLGQAAALDRSAKLVARGDSGRVRFGLGPMYAATLDDIIPALWQAARPIEVEAHILPVERLVARLLRGELDFFVADVRAARGQGAIAVEPIGRDPVGYFVRHGHPLLGRGSLEIEDLAPFALLAPNLPEGRIEHDSDVSPIGTGGAGRFHCERIELLIATAMRTDAVVMATRSAVGDPAKQGRILPLPIESIAGWNAEVGLARLAGMTFAPAVERYAAGIRSMVAARLNSA